MFCFLEILIQLRNLAKESGEAPPNQNLLRVLFVSFIILILNYWNYDLAVNSIRIIHYLTFNFKSSPSFLMESRIRPNENVISALSNTIKYNRTIRFNIT
jgi:hypothetical protein